MGKSLQLAEERHQAETADVLKTCISQFEEHSPQTQ